MNAITVNHLTKKYNNGALALDGLSFTVKSGEIFSLLGQNGAGKSTLIHILSTFLRPSSGSASLFGRDLFRNPAQARCQIACVAQHTSIDTYLSLADNMMFQGRMYGIPYKEALKCMDTLIDAFALAQYAKQPVFSYSGGIKRRLDIALSLMSNPKILFLDEPTVGMDVQSRLAMWEMIKKIRDELNTTVFLTTHYLEEAEHLSDTLCIIKDGKEIVQGTPHELKQYLQQNILKITFSHAKNANDCAEQIAKIFPNEKTEVTDCSIMLIAKNSQDALKRCCAFLLSEQISFNGVEIVQPTIEEVFLRLTTKNNMEAC